MTGRAVLTLLAALSLPEAGAAGAVLEFETTGDSSGSSTTRISAQDGSSRIETAGNEDAAGMIFDGERGALIVLDHERREYSVMDEATMQQMATQVGAAMQQMREALKDMPPEQRAMAEQMMKQQMPQAPADDSTLEETGETVTINGFDCRWYKVSESGRKTTELCVTPWSDIDGGEDVAEPMRRMSAFFEEMARQFSEAAGMDVMGRQQNLFEHMEKLDGYPVLVRDLGDDGGIRSETRLTSAESADVDPALFEPPAGYRETSIGM
jgi:hypothetical protein